MDSPEHRTPIAAIVLAWLIVALPLSWGVYQSVVKSVPLFTGSPSASK